MSVATQSRLAKAWAHSRATWPLYAAAIITIGFVYWTICLASESLVDKSGVPYTRWEEFKNGQPNTMGDTLAGFVGSLTLIWVVASVIQQSMELKAQRREFAEMVRAQDAQVRALQAQAAIFEDEKRHRAESEVGDLFNSLLEELADFIGSHPKMRWVTMTPKTTVGSLIALGQDGSSGQQEPNLVRDRIMLFETLSKNHFNTDAALRTHFRRISKTILTLEAALASGRLTELANEAAKSSGLAERLEAIIELEAKMSLADRVKFRILGVKGALADFEKLCALPVWEAESVSEQRDQDQGPD